MPFQEKRTIVSMLGSLVIFSSYCLYMYQHYQDELLNSSNDFSFWGIAFLILIPISIIARIIIHIIFAIMNKIVTNEDMPSITDERDKLIELKSTRNSYYAFMVGFLLAMISLTMDVPYYSMFIILCVSGFFAEMIAGFSSLYFYRRGI
ncbi:MAG: DUF2178 domain-containing protein [Flavobacteriales bacterium]|nr:DUF2178 domain-containing protein [Flavobacteriales bacterium]